MVYGRSVLSVPNEMAYLPAVQAFAGEVLKSVGFAEDDLERMLVAIEECVANVIKNAFEPDQKASFQVLFDPSATGLRVIVKDKGLPYDPNRVPDYPGQGGIEEVPPRGLGSFIMKKFVDEASFHNLGKEGKELHLFKHLPRKNITEFSEVPVSRPIQKPPSKGSRPSTFEVRLMDPSESLEVSRLFYRTYEYSYFADVMYYPERIAALIEEGLMTSVVAVSQDGEIVGHLAMLKETSGEVIAEAGKGAVKDSCRGSHLLTDMMRFLANEAAASGMKALYGRLVTIHIYSQKMTEQAGFRDCAILLGCAPADIAYKGIAETLCQRGTYIYTFLPLRPLPAAAVYLPPHHEPMLRKIYAHLGLNRDFAAAVGNAPKLDYSTIKSKIITDTNAAEIVLSQYGNDYIRALHYELKNICIKKVDQITLFLDLHDPVTSTACSEIEKLGFFISGVIPCLHFEDTLILQYLNNIRMDYSLIKVHSQMARELLDYIRSMDPDIQR